MDPKKAVRATSPEVGISPENKKLNQSPCGMKEPFEGHTSQRQPSQPSQPGLRPQSGRRVRDYFGGRAVRLRMKGTEQPVGSFPAGI